MSSSSKKIKLTVVQLDLVKSSTFTSGIEKKGGVDLTKYFLENIKGFVQSAFNSVVKHPDEAEEIQSCGGEAYRISLKDVNNAYQFVEKFCALVKENDDQEPNKDKLIFRIGAATGTINFDPSSSGLDRITGHNVLVTVCRLFTANPPGYFYVDQETFNNFDENIKQKFENESVLVPGKEHEDKIIAYGCQMFINTSLPTSEPITIQEIYDLFKKLNQQAQITRVSQLIGMPNDFRPSNYANLYEAKTAIVNWAEGYENGEEYRLQRLNKLKDIIKDIIK
ncbi:MAG: hypothetical protein ACK4ZH_12850 [Dolichospermum sp.]|jgi:hypothetical protein